MESTIWAERERLERSVSLRSVHMASLAGTKEGWLAAATGSGAYVTPAWWTLGVRSPSAHCLAAAFSFRAEGLGLLGRCLVRVHRRGLGPSRRSRTTRAIRDSTNAALARPSPLRVPSNPPPTPAPPSR